MFAINSWTAFYVMFGGFSGITTAVPSGRLEYTVDRDSLRYTVENSRLEYTVEQ